MGEISKELNMLDNIQLPSNEQDDREESERINLKIAQWESRARAQDRFRILAFGLRKRQDLARPRFKKNMLEMVKELKYRYRRLIHMWLDFKEKRELAEF